MSSSTASLSVLLETADSVVHLIHKIHQGRESLSLLRSALLAEATKLCECLRNEREDAGRSIAGDVFERGSHESIDGRSEMVVDQVAGPVLPMSNVPEVRMVQVIDVAHDEVEVVSHQRVAVRQNNKRRMIQPKPQSLSNMSEPPKCPVCWDNVDQATLTPCGHLFCFRCITNALAFSGQSCPVCRTSIVKESQLVSLLEA